MDQGGMSSIVLPLALFLCGFGGALAGLVAYQYGSNRRAVRLGFAIVVVGTSLMYVSLATLPP